ncbi:MAG: chorismate mutase [Spirochaetota bacterium]
MSVKAVRGAVQLEQDTAPAMADAVQRLVSSLVKSNKADPDRIISLIFSQTTDLCSENPARALRRFGYSQVPLFCTSEPTYPDSLPKTLRVLMTFETDGDEPVSPVYLDGARRLRPDLSEERG